MSLVVKFLTASILAAFPAAPEAAIGIDSGGSGEKRKSDN
jgi:hypothetical protein